jgi:hypothetical protein
MKYTFIYYKVALTHNFEHFVEVMSRKEDKMKWKDRSTVLKYNCLIIPFSLLPLIFVVISIRALNFMMFSLTIYKSVSKLAYVFTKGASLYSFVILFV